MLRLAAIAGSGGAATACAAIRELEQLVDLEQLPTRWLAGLAGRVDELSLAAPIADAVRVASLTVWAANQLVIDRARELGDALATARVRAVALKGIELIAAYPSVGHRPLGDLDILVAPHDLDRASEVLRMNGCTVAHGIEPFVLRQRHAVIATRPDHVIVDLHWRASGWLPLGRGGDVERTPWPLGRAVAAPEGHPLHGSGLLILAPADTLAVVAVHGCRPGNERAVHLSADAARIIAARPDLDGSAVLDSLAEVGHRGRGAQWLLAVALDFGVAPPSGIEAVSPSRDERTAGWLEGVASGGSRRDGSSRRRLARSLLAGSLAVTLLRPWRVVQHVVERVRWERSSARAAAKAAAGVRDDD